MGSASSIFKEEYVTKVEARERAGILYTEQLYNSLVPDDDGSNDKRARRSIIWKYVEEHNLTDHGVVFFENLKQLKVGLAGLEGIANKYMTDDIKSIERLTPADDLRQPNVNNETELYESGTKALKVFDELLRRICKDANIDENKILNAPLKGRDRARAKVRNEYNDE